MYSLKCTYKLRIMQLKKIMKKLLNYYKKKLKLKIKKLFQKIF